MAVLYRPGLCDKCARNRSEFCIRERHHRIVRRVNMIDGVVVCGPYPDGCRKFRDRLIANERSVDCQGEG